MHSEFRHRIRRQFLYISILLGALAGCWSQPAHNTTKPNSPGPNLTATNQPPQENAEAEAAAQRFRDLVLTQCDHYYYAGYEWNLLSPPSKHLTQYKNALFPPVIPGRVTPADRENGYLWRGLMVVTGLSRSLKENGDWGEWQDGVASEGREDVALTVELWNRNRHWHYKEGGVTTFEFDLDRDPPTVSKDTILAQGTKPLHKPSCEEVAAADKEATRIHGVEERKASLVAEGLWEDPATGLLWYLDSPESLTADEAKAQCAALKRAGYADWRLPSVDDLEATHSGFSGPPRSDLWLLPRIYKPDSINVPYRECCVVDSDPATTIVRKARGICVHGRARTTHY